MNISIFTFRLLLLFFPGLLCSYIIDFFTVHKERTPFQFLINSFVLGLSSYLLYWLLMIVIGPNSEASGNEFAFLRALTDVGHHISYREIVYACVMAVALGVLVTVVHTYKLHFKLMHKFRITKKFGELDVWGYLMNSRDVEWVTVRAIENNIMYDGWVQAFSDNSEEAELLLGDVRVHRNDTGEHLYDVDSQYLSLDRNNISIEIRRNEN